MTSESIGRTIKTYRKRLGLTQEQLALVSGTGVRFVRELERGKPTCELGKSLFVLNSLGLELRILFHGEDTGLVRGTGFGGEASVSGNVDQSRFGG